MCQSDTFARTILSARTPEKIKNAFLVIWLSYSPTVIFYFNKDALAADFAGVDLDFQRTLRRPIFYSIVK